jgi:tripartite-type tricarboxylate transporter receptor subunit TctC
MAIAPAMNANAGYDPRKDLTPIGMIGFAPNVLVVHPSLPVRSIAELIAYAKAAPAPLQYGSPGVGTVNHLAGEYLAKRSRREVAARDVQGKRSGHGRSPWRPYSDDVSSGSCRGR